MIASNESFSFFDASESFLIMLGFESPCRLLMCTFLNIFFMNSTNLVLILNGKAIDFMDGICEIDEEGKKDVV
jgi:hypothetical protein